MKKSSLTSTLITGPSGSGKTFLAKYFESKGYNAICTDAHKKLASWFNDGGDRVEYPKNANTEFFNSHLYLWDEKILNSILNNNRRLFLFGSSANMFDFINKFDNLFYLEAKKDVLIDRLQKSDRTNPFGKTKKQRVAAVEYSGVLSKQARKNNFRFIDAQRPPKEILKEILSLV